MKFLNALSIQEFHQNTKKVESLDSPRLKETFYVAGIQKC